MWNSTVLASQSGPPSTLPKSPTSDGRVLFSGCLVSFAHLLFDLILASKDILPRSLRPRVFSIGLAFPLQTHPQEHFASLFASANEGEAKSKPGNLAHSESKRRKAPFRGLFWMPRFLPNPLPTFSLRTLGLRPYREKTLGKINVLGQKGPKH